MSRGGYYEWMKRPPSELSLRHDYLKAEIKRMFDMHEGRYDEKHILEALTKKINEKSIYVFEINGEVVSMAARSRSLLKTESVSLVYTPKEHRNQGYASHIVKYVTDLILDEGRTAMLYTDLSNPTSNSIYMNIGYMTYCDSSVFVKPI